MSQNDSNIEPKLDGWNWCLGHNTRQLCVVDFYHLVQTLVLSRALLCFFTVMGLRDELTGAVAAIKECSEAIPSELLDKGDCYDAEVVGSENA